MRISDFKKHNFITLINVMKLITATNTIYTYGYLALDSVAHTLLHVCRSLLCHLLLNDNTMMTDSA